MFWENITINDYDQNLYKVLLVLKNHTDNNLLSVIQFYFTVFLFFISEAHLKNFHTLHLLLGAPQKTENKARQCIIIYENSACYLEGFFELIACYKENGNSL